MILWERASKCIAPCPRPRLALDKMKVRREIIQGAIFVRNANTALGPVTVDCHLDSQNRVCRRDELRF